MPFTEQMTRSRKLLICIVTVIVLILIVLGVSLYNRSSTPDIVPVKKVDIANVGVGLSAAGFKMSSKDVGAIVDKIDYQVSHKQPDFKATVPTREADTIIKQVSDKDKADVVIKEEKPNPENQDQTDLYYYGIHMEKKNAIGIYADLYKEGSAGIHVRRESTIIQVGKAYQGGDIRARVAYEAIKF